MKLHEMLKTASLDKEANKIWEILKRSLGMGALGAGAGGALGSLAGPAGAAAGAATGGGMMGIHSLLNQLLYKPTKANQIAHKIPILKQIMQKIDPNAYLMQ